MKKQLKIFVVALVLAVNSTMLFAADLDTSITDIESVRSMAFAKMSLPLGDKSVEQNIGLVSQVGESNVGYINQTHTGNFAAIMQNSTSAGVANVSYVFQSGSNNRAVIDQR